MIQTIGQRILDWLNEEFHSERLWPALTAGVVIGVSDIIFDISMGSLIFSGELTRYLSYGIGIALVTSSVVMIVASLTSSVPGVICSTQDSFSVILAVVVAGLVTTLATTRLEDKLATVLTAITFTTVLTGIFFLALGSFKLGGLVRFIPYPVVGGFLAGTGWLLLRGSFGVMTGMPLTMANIPALLQSGQLLIWVPAACLALLLFFSLRRFRHVLTMPGILIGAIVLFYLVLWATGTSIESATRRGLFLSGMSGEIAWQPLALKNLLAANWTSILGQGSNIAIILVVGVVSLLMNASALELTIRKDVDLNRELQSAGIASILSGVGGGMAGYHTLDLSALSHRMGARSRLPGLVSGAVCAAMLFAGSALVAYFPKPALGGVLLFLGLDFLYEWVIAGWSRLARTDYAVVLLILVVIATTNFLVGVGVGLVAMIILFVLDYSRINVVHHALSGADMRSNFERCATHRRALIGKLGQHIYILELQGFLFFGTANSLLERIRARLADRPLSPVRYLILDLRRVTGLDSSAVISFLKCKQIAEAQGITLVLTHISEKMQRQFELGGLSESGRGVRVFPDLDHGLEWCEGELLASERIAELCMPVTLSAQLADSGFKKADSVRLSEFLERIEVAEGEYLIRQGEEADKMYFIEDGVVSVYLEMGSGKRVRLRTHGLGTAVGELGLYLGTTRTASVITDSPVIAYRLTRTALLEMEQQEPALAAAFHKYVARLQSERLAALTRTVEAVLR